MMRIVFFCLSCCLVGWLFCDIDPNETYTWFSGIWHGIFFPVNFVRSLLTDALYKAEGYTTAYNVFYWIVVLSWIPSIIVEILKVFANR